ncbi:hypothetical protein LAZ67_23000088 [Cordylochernes scorpioides]|uniref:Uncharacterized protein n=1 Tax=Cordylochernes scorpioides TaxID=51811 RepID=A0ABY6LQ23_9ARAC|nr:hypothetical protein LAZ67_23000088 [Cordylochernes scorpioides]
MNTILYADMATTKVPGLKVILCGEYGVGKSSLFRRFATNTFVASSDRSSTLGLDHYDRVFLAQGRQVKLQLWDTGGMERIASVTSSYYKFAEAAILVFSFDSPDSFNLLSQHLLEIVNYAETAQIFICGNKTDLVGQQCVTDADIQQFCEQCHTLISGVFRTSCKTGEGVATMFDTIARQLVANFRPANLANDMEELIRDSFKVSEPEDGPQEACFC